MATLRQAIESDSPTHSDIAVDEKVDKQDVGVSSAFELPEEVAARRLKAYRQDAQWDPNLGNDDLNAIDEVVDQHDVEGENKVLGELTENSPYAEVRAAVRNYDIDVPCNTIRAWVLGMLMTTIGSGLNMLFALRSPSITITSIVSQLLIWPVGIAWDYVIPNRQFNVMGVRFNFSPGPFNIKEHTLIVIMANASFGTGVGYFTDTTTAQRGFYKLDWGWGFSILLGLTTQCAGFGLAGLARRWLVEPAAMIWPQDLVNCALMYALHDHSKTDPTKTNGWSVSRYRYFFYVFAGSFFWYFFPGWIAQFLQVFAFATWAAPNNVIVNQVFGGYTGMSLIPLTFDWTYISGYIFSPLVSPWHAIGNSLLGVVFFFWIVGAGIHFSGTWYAAYLPYSDSNSYDNTASLYNVSRILTPEYTLDLAKYEAYSPLFLSTTFALCYGLSFAAISSVIVHTGLFHGRQIIRGFKDSRKELDDTHTKMMRKYRPVPEWWFAVLSIVFIGLSFAVIYVWDTKMPAWALIIAFLISFVWMVPIGMVQAITNIQLGLNVFTEFIVGYMLPGKPNAMMLFKTYGYITMTQGLAFVQDMKLGHYLKIPPRTMFFGQVIATVWSVIVQTAVFEWAFGGGIPDICAQHQTSRFTCPNGRVFFNASVIWGVIGPQRIFSGTGFYKSMQWFWLIGAITPVILYFAARRSPRSWVRFLSAPIIFGGNGQIPPATPLNYLAWGAVGFVFNKWIRSRYRGWWMRFNYLTSAGLDVGLALCTILIVLTLSLTNQTPPQWWGNVGALNTMDAQDTAVQAIAADTFGPATW